MPDRGAALKFECGGGCAASTAGDYLRFGQMLLDGGALNGTRILGRKSVEAMTSDQMTPEIKNNIAVTNPNGAGYGFGVTVAVRPRRAAAPGSSAARASSSGTAPTARCGGPIRRSSSSSCS